MAVLSPQPKMQFTTAAGVPLSGGKVYTYTAGTTTPQATFTDSTGGTPNTNPVILDSRGEANIWLGGALYKFKLTDANDVEIWTVDYISAPTSAVSPVLSGSVTIDSDTPGPALRITQTGTGPVLRVQDSADPDTTPFIIDTNGNLGLGTPTPTVQLEATGAARIGSLTLTSAPLPVASGGTGLATLTANNVLIGAGTSSVAFVAPGASGHVLTSNGTTWNSQAPATVPAPNRQVFTSSGTWTKPAGYSADTPVIIEVWGAGGGGSTHAAGGGGGGGAYSQVIVNLGSLGATVAVTVGTGGAAGFAGGVGGTSSFGSLLSAFGGNGGYDSGAGGGGGGGTMSAGTGSEGGRPAGGVSGGGSQVDSSFGGGAGGTPLNSVGWSSYGGGGGGRFEGGRSVYGGGGGAGVVGSGGPAGTSSYGGNGGAANSPGVAPAGGGGRNAAGARGEVRVTITS